MNDKAGAEPIVEKITFGHTYPKPVFGYDPDDAQRRAAKRERILGACRLLINRKKTFLQFLR